MGGGERRRLEMHTCSPYLLGADCQPSN